MKSNITQFRSINVKLILAIILASTCITAVATLFNVYIDYLNEKEVQNLTLEQIKSSALNSTIQTAWDLDDYQTFSNLENIFFIHDINSIKIVDADGKLIFDQQKQVEEAVEKYNFSMSYPLIREHNGEVKKFGVMTVGLTNYYMYRRILKKLFVYFITQGVKTFIISFVMMSIFNFYVTRHLNSLVSHFSNETANGDAKIKLPAGKGKKLKPLKHYTNDQHYIDEFDLLASTFNELVQTVNKRYDNQQSQYEMILSSAGEGIICLDTENKISYINVSGASLLGWRTEDLIDYEAKSVLLPNSNGPESDCEFLKSLNGVSHFPICLELQFKRRGNLSFPVECTMAKIRDHLNNASGTVIVFKDISEKIIVQKQLIEAKDLAESALETKKRFLANMSHEIRTPLNGIIGFSSLLLDSQLEKDDLEHVKTIQECSESLLILVNSILEFSRIEQGKLEVHAHKMNIEQCTNSAISIFKKTLVDKNISLKLEIENGTPIYIKSDFERIKQVLVNLIGNAVKFTDNGNIDIRIKASHLDNYLYEYQITVADTGIGIPDNMQEKLFNRFTQVDNSSTRKYGGTGLGLAISKGLVELLGGEIWLFSQHGQGSDFHFTITTEVYEMSPLFSPADSSNKNIYF